MFKSVAVVLRLTFLVATVRFDKRWDLKLTLIAPSGTVAVLLQPRPNVSERPCLGLGRVYTDQNRTHTRTHEHTLGGSLCLENYTNKFKTFRTTNQNGFFKWPFLSIQT